MKFLLVVLLIITFLLAIPITVNAAIPDVCEEVVSIGLLKVFYCEPDIGPPFYLNSLGFMLLDN